MNLQSTVPERNLSKLGVANLTAHTIPVLISPEPVWMPTGELVIEP